jgi:hypothetical protein
MVLAAVGMVSICGIAGFAIDVGSWYQAQRKVQAVADAAAIGAAKDLPGSQSQATSDAQSYATKNSGSLSGISYSTKYMSGDTITVTASASSPSFFLKVLGISSANVTATASATAENIQTVNGAMPFGVINTQPQLSGSGCPCYGVTTSLTVGTTGPGGFGLVNVDGSSGPQSPSKIAGWITNGCSCSTAAPVWLYGSPGARFNSSAVKTAMATTIGKTMLFPVYDTTQGNGANLQYHVVGWAAFTITSYNIQGSSGSITGYFVKTDWSGTATTSTSNYYGVTSSVLTN